MQGSGHHHLKSIWVHQQRATQHYNHAHSAKANWRYVGRGKQYMQYYLVIFNAQLHSVEITLRAYFVICCWPKVRVKFLYAHQGSAYLIKYTVKLWNIFAIQNSYFLCEYIVKCCFFPVITSRIMKIIINSVFSDDSMVNKTFFLLRIILKTA